MKKILAVGFVIGLLVSAAAISDEPVPQIGYAAFASFDQLWLYSGKVKTGMFSSTDPKGGNMDMWSFHGRYRGEPVLAKIEGPGCVYRIWSALASGRLKVYLDGKTRPEINCGFKEYLKGKCEGLPGDFIAGHANYMPIPFAKSIVITAPGFSFPAYYQVSFQTYDPSVRVQSFKKSEVESASLLKSARASWARTPANLPEQGLSTMSQTLTTKSELILEPNSFVLSKSTPLPGTAQDLVMEIPDAGVIRKLVIKNQKDPADPLLGLGLKIFWDGSDQPAIDVPIDAFFLNQPDLKEKWPGGELKNLFLYAGRDGYACSFPMPFAHGAKIVIPNPGKERELQINAFWETRESLPPNAMRFHALYRSQEFPENEKKENIFTFRTPVNPEKNWVALDERGKGNYVGAAIFVKSVGTVWWGEGDEMDWIDGSAKPQIQGTGTEDEFNWGWGFKPVLSPVSGTLPLVPKCKESIVAQIIPAFRNKECQKIRGDNIAFRLRPSDYVPFESSIKASYEILGNSFLTPRFLLRGNLSQERGDDYASMAYWYEMP